MAAVDFLASRGMGGPGSPRDPSRGVVTQGKKVAPSAVASQAIEAQPSFGQIKPWRGRVVSAEQHRRGEDVLTANVLHKRSGFPGRRKGNPGVQNGQFHDPAIRADSGTAMARVSIGLETHADPSAQTNTLAFQGHADEPHSPRLIPTDRR